MKEIMDEIEAKFIAALEEKTGWGKNEVAELYKDIAKSVYLSKLDQILNRNS